MSDKLSDVVLSEYGKSNIKKLEIPAYISENLSKELREYQKEALKMFLAQRELCNDDVLKQNHLMFNMATGSGKTLIMAALMLDCFKNGYRNFIFFVNSTAILEKTKENFCNASSSKYLFAQTIIINSQRVQINAVSNLYESKQDCINIHFSTIQGLYSVLTNQRENALSFLDFKESKIVFLADEAHHLNSDTKKSSKSEGEANWESIITKAFRANEQNLMLEFSATIPKDKNVLEKYKDKIIYEYALKAFCQNGFSKRIFLVKYDDRNIQTRFLGGLLASLYRELLAYKHNILLKPVMLFKSESIASSKKNEEAFLAFVQNIKQSDIESFYHNIKPQIGEIFSDSLMFFKNEFKANYTQSLLDFIKAKFKKAYILNVNHEAESDKYQILLNSLEDASNAIRIIFAVNKLNEGWDVLNLFDIVRLNEKIATKETTTSEVQLIGRGARYYPFWSEKFHKDCIYKRKFDNDLYNELSHLERLSYHTLNDVNFITSLNKEMSEQGLINEEEKPKYELKLSKYAKEIVKTNEIYYAKNKREKRNLFNNHKIKQIELQRLNNTNIPLFAQHIQEQEVSFDKQEDSKHNVKSIKFNELSYRCFLKALNIAHLGFDTLQAFDGVASKREFYEKFLAPLELNLHQKQDINNRHNQLQIIRYILENLQKILHHKKQDVIVSDFALFKLDLGEKMVFVSKDKNNQDKIIINPEYEWLYYDKVPYDSQTELKFLEFIEAQKDRITQKFDKWIVVRNEGFDEFKLYDNRVDKSTYGTGFEPDFIFFGKQKDDGNIFALQCFMEVKGSHLSGDNDIMGIDTWKEDFLHTLSGKKICEMINENDPKQLTIESLPFYKDKNKLNKNFYDAFAKILEK